MSKKITAAAGLAAGFAATAWAVRGRSSFVFDHSFWRGEPGRKAIALTFDDGPTPSTPQFLDLLEEHRIPATFFEVGLNVNRHPEIAREVLAAGHEIGNHSHVHLNYALKPPRVIQDDFSRAQAAIEDATGFTPTLMRAPYGVRWFGFRQMQAKLGLAGIMWTVIGLDWKLSAEAIANRVLSRVTDGGIICLHDGRALAEDPDVTPTLEALRRIIPPLVEAGYHFETISQLLWPANPLTPERTPSPSES
ncbi:MAG TPA: polysaccharide deacetylase family protein [Bryobacteraceae bacterium]|nr:polysaccharide deacetylase family protein [Bryobacteraceae bacterium]